VVLESSLSGIPLPVWGTVYIISGRVLLSEGVLTGQYALIPPPITDRPLPIGLIKWDNESQSESVT